LAGAGTTLIRAIDGHGQIVDAYVSPTRDLAAARRFFERAIAYSGTTPRRVITDKVAKNRVHLDVRAAPGLQGEERMAALEVECDRLLALGATRVRRYEPAPPMNVGLHRDDGPRRQRVLPGLRAPYGPSPNIAVRKCKVGSAGGWSALVATVLRA
jgi:hypothetical protein